MVLQFIICTFFTVYYICSKWRVLYFTTICCMVASCILANTPSDTITIQWYERNRTVVKANSFYIFRAVLTICNCSTASVSPYNCCQDLYPRWCVAGLQAGLVQSAQFRRQPLPCQSVEAILSKPDATLTPPLWIFWLSYPTFLRIGMYLQVYKRINMVKSGDVVLFGGVGGNW